MERGRVVLEIFSNGIDIFMVYVFIFLLFSDNGFVLSLFEIGF